MEGQRAAGREEQWPVLLRPSLRNRGHGRVACSHGRALRLERLNNALAEHGLPHANRSVANPRRSLWCVRS